MIRIWTVEHGHYDDYEVGPVFSNKAAAESFCDQMNEIFGDPGEYHYTEWGVLDECPVIHTRYSIARFQRYEPNVGWENLRPMVMVVDEPVSLEVSVTYGRRAVLYVQGPDEAEVMRAYREKLEELGWE